MQLSPKINNNKERINAEWEKVTKSRSLESEKRARLERNERLSELKSVTSNVNVRHHVARIEPSTKDKSLRDNQVVEIANKTKTPLELEREYQGLSRDLNKVVMKSQEHSHGGLFPSKHKTYKPLEKEEYRNKVTEVCPCCIGVLDLDEAASLGKLSSANEHKIQLGEVNHVPSSGFEWFASVIGGYFALAGLYFGSVNFSGSLDRLKRLKNILKKNDENIDKVAKDKKSTNEELKNLEAYKKSIKYSVLDGRYQKWGDGAMPAVGSSAMLGSLIYSPLTVPALGVMTAYALGHSLKSGYDLYRHSKVDLTKLKEVKGKFSEEGKTVFKKRFEQKKSFFKKVITSYMSYGAGTGILGAAAIASMASAAFPPALLAVGAVFLLAGVISTVYFNNRFGRTYAPKNENHINRQMSGNEKGILARLAMIQRQKNEVEKFRNESVKNVKEKSPGMRIKENLKTFRYYALTLLTLGVPHKVRGMKKELKVEFSKDIEKATIESETRRARLNYFRGSMENQVKYLEDLKSEVFQLDLSALKPYIKNSDKIPHEKIRKAFVEVVNHEIEDKQKLINRFDETMKLSNKKYDLVNTWDYLNKNGLIGATLEKFYDELETTKRLDEYEKYGFVTVLEKKVKDNGHHHHDEEEWHDHEEEKHEHEHKGHEHEHHHEHEDHHEHEHDHQHEHNHEDDGCDGGACNIKPNKGHEHVVKETSFNMGKVLNELDKSDPKAVAFYKQFVENVNYTLMNTLDDELEYQKHELCNHIEDRLRK